MGTPTNSAKWTWSFWLKRGKLAGSDYPILYSAGIVAAEDFGYFRAGTEALWVVCNSVTILASTQVFRDTAAWYNMIFVFDGGNATASNRLRVYLNGVEITAWATDLRSTLTSSSSNVNKSGTVHRIATDAFMGAGDFYDGYLTEINFIDGQALTPSSFGSTNAITGVWQPAKYTGTYGNNGFYLNFSSNGTSAALGTDFSGNSNTWTVNNISVTAGATYDSMLDVPTLTSATVSNYPVMNPLNRGSNGTGPADGNLSWGAGGHATCLATMGASSGKWYAEFTLTTSSAGGFGITSNQAAQNAYPGAIAGLWWIYDNTGSFNIASETSVTYSGASRFTTNQVWQVALDITNGKCFIGTGNSWVDSAGGSTGNPSTGANPTFTFTAGTQIFYMLEVAGCVWAANFGQRAFTNTPPTGFISLNAYNLPDSTITNGAAYMAATLYTGNGSTQSVSNAVNGISFQPDYIWIKRRNTASNHQLYDSIRGVQKALYSDLTSQELTQTGGVTAFNSSGFTVGSDAGVNASGDTQVAWNWKAGGTSSSNTNGTITSTVSAGATQGFSVVTFTGNGTAGATRGHGLGVTPAMIILKSRSAVGNWPTYHQNANATPQNGGLYLNATDAFASAAGFWNNTAPTSTVFSTGGGADTNANGTTYVAYCFSAVAGYSAFGSYTGNGSADGPFLFLGFRPRFILIKRTDSTANWRILDTSRDTSNVESLELYPSLSNAEGTFAALDGLSNGFKIRNTDASYNASGGTYIYACFAENPFKNALAR